MFWAYLTWTLYIPLIYFRGHQLLCINYYIDYFKFTAIRSVLKRKLLIFSNVFHFPYPTGLTPCQARQKLSTGLLGEFVPKCKSDGSFEPIQSHEGYFWCVDTDGKEVNGTRKHLQKPTCAMQLKSGKFWTLIPEKFHFGSKWSAFCRRYMYCGLMVCTLYSFIKYCSIIIIWVQLWLLCKIWITNMYFKSATATDIK